MNKYIYLRSKRFKQWQFVEFISLYISIFILIEYIVHHISTPRLHGRIFSSIEDIFWGCILESFAWRHILRLRCEVNIVKTKEIATMTLCLPKFRSNNSNDKSVSISLSIATTLWSSYLPKSESTHAELYYIWSTFLRVKKNHKKVINLLQHSVCA